MSIEHQSGSPFDRDEDTKPREPGCKCHWEEGDSPCPVHGENEEGPIATSHHPGSPGVDLDEFDKLHAKCTRGRVRVNRYDNEGYISYQLQSERVGKFEVLGQISDEETVSAELRTLRARVGELESKLSGALHAAQDAVEANERLTARAESAEARVKELDAAANSWNREVNAALDDRADRIYLLGAELRSAESRITDLESQLAAARSNSAQLSEELLTMGDELAAAREEQEQGLEAKAREVLGERFVTLMIRRSSSENRWMASWLSSDDPSVLSYAGMLPADRDTLPALLRAILEVEAQP